MTRSIRATNDEQRQRPVAPRPSFLVTIDTEGDNIWAAPRKVRTENARFLRRFQNLCEAYGLRPTYLTNYEMAMDVAYCSFAREVLTAGTAEIGMHLHGWNSPPIVPLGDDDDAHMPYLTEYPTAVLDAKVDTMTSLLEDTFQVKMRSHRGGRFAFDERYARALIRNGYTADCSVTPRMSWRIYPGHRGGPGGADFTAFRDLPYFVDPNDISRSGRSPLLEVPLTTASFSNRFVDAAVALASTPALVVIDRRQILRRGLRRLFPDGAPLIPNATNRRRMERLLDRALAEERGYAEMLLHSSELMPGGSPWSTTERDVERLYGVLEAMFEIAGDDFHGATVSEFREAFGHAHGHSPQRLEAH